MVDNTEKVRSAFLYRVVDGIYDARIPVPGVWTRRTFMEKTFLTAGVGWLAWKAYDMKMHDQIAPVMSSVMPGFRWVLSKIRGPRIVHKDEQGIVKMESTRAGSEEQNMSIPCHQCGIAIVNDKSELEIIGCAVRFPELALVGPDHVLADNSVKYAVGRQGQISLEGKERIALETDLAMIFLSEQEFSRIGMAMVKIGGLPVIGSVVTVVNSKGFGTAAVLKRDASIFGRVCYAGTTVGGYSGAAYMSGAQMLGVHQFGGKVNGGYSASYLWAILRVAVKQAPEDSDEWLMGQYKARNKIGYKVWGLDEVAIDINGTFSVVTRSAMNRAFGAHWENDQGFLYAGSERSYNDVTPESTLSGESIDSLIPGASSIVEESQALVKSLPHELINAFATLSPELQKDFRKSLSAYDTLRKATAGPVVKAIQPKNSIA